VPAQKRRYHAPAGRDQTLGQRTERGRMVGKPVPADDDRPVASAGNPVSFHIGGTASAYPDC
jgi:hypothetical protein